jgi:hypothetical protein
MESTLEAQNHRRNESGMEGFEPFFVGLDPRLRGGDNRRSFR